MRQAQAYKQRSPSQCLLVHVACCRALQRMCRMFESVNFKDYIRLLAPFSAKASRDIKIGAMFAAYDIDDDGES